MVKWTLRLEGLALLLTAIYLYHIMAGNWLIFILFLFVPDVSMIGYLKDKKLGAVIYNIFHNIILPLLLLFLGLLSKNDLIAFAGIILLAHVGIDRLCGYGLKYPTDFKNTHLQKV